MAIALERLRVWDGFGDAVARDVTLRIEGDRIAAIGSSPDLMRAAEHRDLAGCTALPGLIDAHVHMTLDPERGDMAEQLAIPAEQLESAMETRAAAMLRSGITTARDLGGAEWREIELRDRIARGEIPGPRLLCAGQPLTSPKGHCHYWGGEAATRSAIRATVRRQCEHGADWIKIMASGGLLTKGTSAQRAQFASAEIREAVEEASRHGRHVAAHCHATEGIRNAVAGGVRTIEHCSWVGESGFAADLDPEVLAAMAGRSLWISSTVNRGWSRFLEKDGKPTELARRMKACFRAARELGIPILASTDAGIPGVEHHGIGDALPVFAEYAGYSPLEALRAATSESARALGIESETGGLRSGLAADVLVVAGDPLRDLTALARPVAVYARGREVPLDGELSPERSR